MFVSMPPPIDLLLSGKGCASPWPSHIVNNSRLKLHVEMRKKVYAILRDVFNKIPEVKMDISEAIHFGLINQDEIAKTYDGLAEFLLSDVDHGRLILYLPFELMPDRRSEVFRSGLLDLASKRFIDAYILNWKELLNESDFRADYVDGDILEYELDEVVLPHVRKAAHLIPEMIKKNFISVAEVLEVLEETNDEVLVYSILDTFPILSDLGFVSENEWRRLFNSNNPVLDKHLLNQYKNIRPKPLPVQAKGIAEIDYDSIVPAQINQILDCLKKDLENIRIDCERNEIKTAPKSRVDWLERERRDQCFEEYGDFLASAFREDRLRYWDAIRLIINPNDQVASMLGVITARKIVEKLLKIHRKIAMAAKDVLKPFLCALWRNCTPKVKDQLSITWFHWLAVGLMERSEFEELGLEIPSLDSFASEPRLIDGDLNELGPMLESFYSQPEVSELFYPVFIFFGSRLKGYSLNFNSDLDLAVFIRPDIPQSEELKIKSLLEKVCSHPKIRGRVVEFRLNKVGSRLEIKSSPMVDALVDGAMINNSWAHLLLCGMWHGQRDSINELYKKLLPNFLFSAGQNIKGHRAKKIWLRMIESEVLQYRLMHKGYSRFYPREDWPRTEHSWLMDPDSTFWDPGYRRIATKLFVARVFLPELN